MSSQSERERVRKVPNPVVNPVRIERRTAPLSKDREVTMRGSFLSSTFLPRIVYTEKVRAARMENRLPIKSPSPWKEKP